MNPIPVKPILVLAGGFGSRLRSAVPYIPKPLAPVNGKPFLIHLMENLVLQGGREFVLLLHYRAELIKSVISDAINKNDITDVKVTFIVEKTPLGTGGSIINAINFLRITDPFLVINADTWLGTGLQKLNLSPDNSIATVEVKDCSRYGSLVINGNKIEKFLGKNQCAGPGPINAGFYHLNPEVLTGFNRKEVTSLESDIFPILTTHGLLAAIELNTNFIDIGVPDDYFRFCNWVELGKINEL